MHGIQNLGKQAVSQSEDPRCTYTTDNGRPELVYREKCSPKHSSRQVIYDRIPKTTKLEIDSVIFSAYSTQRSLHRFIKLEINQSLSSQANKYLLFIITLLYNKHQITNIQISLLCNKYTLIILIIVINIFKLKCNITIHRRGKYFVTIS